MLKFVLKRLAAGVLLVVAATTLVFVLLFGSGGANIASKILGDAAQPAQIAAKAAELGLDRPVLVQYWDWLSGAAQGNLGRSWFSHEPVLAAVSSRLSITLSLVIAAIVIVAVMSVVLGATAAIKGGRIDKALQAISVTGHAVPNFWVGLLLVIGFALTVSWFPATGFVPFSRSPGEWAHSITLPVFALSLGATSAGAQQIRGGVLRVLNQDYVRTLESRGLPWRSVMLKHVLRNAAPPALVVISLQLIGMLAGTVTLEKVFAINGMGMLAVNSTVKGDIPMVMGVMITMAIMVTAVNLVIDILNGWINPKARLA